MNEMADNHLDSLYGNHERSYLDSIEEYTLALTGSGFVSDDSNSISTSCIFAPIWFTSFKSRGIRKTSLLFIDWINVRCSLLSMVCINN